MLLHARHHQLVYALNTFTRIPCYSFFFFRSLNFLTLCTTTIKAQVYASARWLEHYGVPIGKSFVCGPFDRDVVFQPTLLNYYFWNGFIFVKSVIEIKSNESSMCVVNSFGRKEKKRHREIKEKNCFRNAVVKNGSKCLNTLQKLWRTI